MKRYNEMNLRAILTGICMLCLFACNEDKGNYDYAEINRVSEFSDIKEEYSVEMGERLQISPKMEMEIDNPDDFDYTWYYKSEGAWNVLQEGRDFDFVIADPIGAPNNTYTCAFEAKNKHTGVAYRTTFNIKVTGTFNKGYVVLYEKENEFDMGMMVLNAQNQYLPKYDILASVAPDLQREGVKPYDIKIFNDNTAPHPYHKDGSGRSVYLLTDQYTTRLKVVDFTWDPSYDLSNMVEKNSPIYRNYVEAGRPVIAEKMVVSHMNSNARTYIYMKGDDGNKYWYLYTTWPVLYFLSYPMNAYRGKLLSDYQLYQASPFVATCARTTLFFNEEKNDFTIQILPSGPNQMGTDFFFSKDFLDESRDHIFNFHDENDGLFYMAERCNAGSSFAILKQKNGTFKFIEFENAMNESDLVAKEKKLRACTFAASTGIGRAKFIAAAPAPNNAFVYYATDDNRLFYADITGTEAKVVEITPVAIKEGYSEITMMKFVPNSGNKYLGIATYNPSLKDKGGRITFYVMPSATSGMLALIGHKIDEENEQMMSWDGFGKITGLDYKP